MRLASLILLSVLVCGCSNSGAGKNSSQPIVFLSDTILTVPQDTSQKEETQDSSLETEGDAELPDTLSDASSVDEVIEQPDADTAADVDEVPGAEKDSDALLPDADVVDAGPTKPQCVDVDGDGYGENCPYGPDCNDSNPNFGAQCPDCTKQNFVGCVCQQAAANCYSGDPQWIGKGVCIAGIQLCVNGYWQACKGEVLPAPEVCNGVDDNCNGLVDEGVLSSCGTCDLSCKQQQIGPDSGTPFDVSEAKGVKLNGNGYIELDVGKSAGDLSHIWIANSSENTVSRLNTKTGWEEGRYKSCGNPSRTSVDLNGDVWVGCRADGGVMKIAVNKNNCVDKNGNGAIETSTDLDGSHTISGNEMLPSGQDECVVVWTTPKPGESIVRAAGVDKENHVWMGGWNTKTLFRLEPLKGTKVDEVSLGCPPYGLVIDQKGVIWVQCTSGGLTRVDPNVVPHTVQSYQYPAGAYGINVDMLGNIWVASGGNASRFNPSNGQWNVVPLQSSGGRGVATSNDGYTYVAVDSGNRVVKINSVTLVNEGAISLGSGRFPVGIAVDFDGFIWAVNQSKASTSKIDPKTMQVISEGSVGAGPYTYSDMTGYTLHNYTAPKGNFKHTFGISDWSGTIAQFQTTVTWEEFKMAFDAPPGSEIRFRYRTADTLKDIEAVKWSENVGPFPPAMFPYAFVGVKGRFLQVEIFLQANDKKLSPIVKSLSAKGKTVLL